MKKLKYIILFLVLFFPADLNALSSYVVMDSNTGRILGESNKDNEMLIASTTKIMTAIVALEHEEATSVLCAGKEILEVYGSMIYIDQNECMTLYDLLVGLMLRSGNDAAMVIATNILGYDKFINEMNNTALKLGMNNTHFSNPHGLDEKDENISTAYDLALLMRYALKNKLFMEIDSIKKYRVTTNVETHLWYNKNQLLTNYKYATGGKIGYTERAGHTFVSSASKAKEDLVVVTMKDSDRFNTHKNLYEEYFNKYDNYKILDKYNFVIDSDYYKDYHLYIHNDVYMMLNKSELKDVNLKIDLIKKKKVKNGEKVGTVKVYVKDKFILDESIYAINRETKEDSIKSKLFFWKK